MSKEEFTKELEKLINRFSIESESNTPDFVLAQYIRGVMDCYNEAVRARDRLCLWGRPSFRASR